MPRDCTGTLAPNPTPKCEFVLDVQSPVLASGDPMTTPKKPTVQKSGRSKGHSQNTKQTAPRQSAAPVAVSSMQRSMHTQNRSRRIKNSEFIGDLYVQSNFSVQSYVLNPGMLTTFPWLSEQAKNWQQYRFHSVRFRYVTRVGTSTIGSVILSPEYNSSDNPPRNEREAMNTMDAVEDVVWREVSTTLNVSAMFALGPRKQIRSGMVTGDVTVYDAGAVHAVAAYVTISPPGSSIGKLWIDYDVELFVPQTATTLFPQISQKMLTLMIRPGTILSTGPTWYAVNLAYDELSPHFDFLNTLQVDVSNILSTDTFALPEGHYMFQVWASYQTWSNTSNGPESHFRIMETNSQTVQGYETSVRRANSASGEGLKQWTECINMFCPVSIVNLGPGVQTLPFQIQNQQPDGAVTGGIAQTVTGGAVVITLL